MNTSLKFAGILVVALLTAWGASAATIDVSPPQNITGTSSGSGNGYYERDPELLMASGGTWYLIYSRSQTGFTAGGNPDNYKYDTYYQTSNDNGATWSVAAKILDAAAISANASFRSATICEADGKIWVIAANVEGLEGDIYATTYSGGSWSAQAMIFDGTFNTGAFHVDAVADGDDIRLFYGIQHETEGVGFIKYHGSSDTWDAAVTKIGASAGWQVPRVIKEGSTYYVVTTDASHILFTSTTTPDGIPWPTATAITNAPPGGGSWDPCILKYGESGGSNDLIVFHAPGYPDDSQPQEYVYSTDGGLTWSGSTAFTECVHGTSLSWDMMPRAYMKDSNTIISFFGMEDRSVSRGQADIVAVTWDISATIGNAHYTTIQDGVDNASTGDVVSIAAGTYVEQVKIGKNLALAGSGASTVVLSPDILTTGWGSNKPVIYAHDATNIVIRDLVVDGAGKGNANARMIGIGYRQAGGTIENCTVKNVKDTPFGITTSLHSGIIVSDVDNVSHSLTISGNTVREFQASGMYVYSSSTTPLAIDVSGNTIVGVGPTSAIKAQNGIQLGTGTSASGLSGTVAGNTFSGIASLFVDGDGNHYMGVNILPMRSSNLSITGNTVLDGQCGIYDADCACTISNNNISVSVINDIALGVVVEDPPGMMFVAEEEPEAVGGSGGGLLFSPQATTLDIDIAGNAIKCRGPSYPHTMGMSLNAGYATASGGIDDLDINASRNVITGFDYGVVIDQCSSGCSGGRFVGLVANHNGIFGNTSYGMWSNVSSPIVDATLNWWGDASGPGGSGPGSGNGVYGPINYDPWIGKAGGENIVCNPDPRYLTNLVPTNTVAANYLGGGGGLIYAYSVSVSWDASKATLNGITEGALLSGAGPTWFEVHGSGNSRTVDCTLMGALPGVAGPGTMFTLSFTGTGQGSSPVDITVLEARDNTNASLTGFIEDDGELIVDVTNPSVTGVFIDNQTLPHTDDWVKNGDYVCVTATVTDAGGIASIYADLSQIGGGSSVAPDSYVYDVATWCLTVSGTPLNGTVSVTVAATDLLGNTGTGYDTIIADNEAPGGIADLAAAQQKTANDTNGTTKIALTFTAPGDAYQVEVWRAGYGSYPEYDDGGGAAPAPPGSYGTIAPPWYVTGVTATGQKDEPAGRDFWYYVAFVKDIALNVSTVSNRTGGTLNYHLGDVTDGTTPGSGDNSVGTVDFSALSGSYWKNLAPGDPVNYLDVGPTTDYSTNARPATDNLLNFEDLMMLALNFTTVSLAPDGSAGRFENPRVDLVVDGAVGGVVRAHIVLAGNRQGVKGMHAAISYDAAALEFAGVSRGGLIVGQTSPVFFENLGGSGKVQVDLAAMFATATLQGSGEVAVIELRVIGTGNSAPILTAVDMRDKANKPIGKRIEPRQDDTLVSDGATPAAFGAYPNPFSGSTEIVFSVPAATAVSLKVYDVNGRLVRNLVDGTLSAGSHRVVWDGRTAAGAKTAPGVYMAVVRIGSEEQASKMFLLP